MKDDHVEQLVKLVGLLDQLLEKSIVVNDHVHFLVVALVSTYTLLIKKQSLNLSSPLESR